VIRILLQLSILCSVIFVFPGFAVSIEVADLVNKATLKEAEYEKLIGDYIKVETLASAVEPKLAKTISYGKGVKTRSDIVLINKGKKISSVSIYDGKYKWTINASMKVKLPQDSVDQLKNDLKSSHVKLGITFHIFIFEFESDFRINTVSKILLSDYPSRIYC